MERNDEGNQDDLMRLLKRMHLTDIDRAKINSALPFLSDLFGANALVNFFQHGPIGSGIGRGRVVALYGSPPTHAAPSQPGKKGKDPLDEMVRHMEMSRQKRKSLKELIPLLGKLFGFDAVRDMFQTHVPQKIYPREADSRLRALQLREFLLKDLYYTQIEPVREMLVDAVPDLVATLGSETREIQDYVFQAAKIVIEQGKMRELKRVLLRSRPMKRPEILQFFSRSRME